DHRRRYVIVRADARDGVLNGACRIQREGLAVKVCTKPSRSGEKLFLARGGDNADDRLGLMKHADRNTPGGHAVDEGACSVDRIDHPREGGTALGQSVFLPQDTIIRESGFNPAADKRLNLAVRDGHDILKVALGLDHQGLAPAEIVQRDKSGLSSRSFGQGKSGFQPCNHMRRHGIILDSKKPGVQPPMIAIPRSLNPIPTLVAGGSIRSSAGSTTNSVPSDVATSYST